MDKGQRADGSSLLPIAALVHGNTAASIASTLALDLLNYILPHIPGSLLEVENTSGRSTPLHWAAVNAHLSIAQAIISHPGGPGPLLINAHNAAGVSPLGEAELAGADDVAKWFVEVMTIEQGSGIVEGEDTEVQAQEDEGSATQGPGGSKTMAKESTEPESQASKGLDGSVEKLTLSEKP